MAEALDVVVGVITHLMTLSHDTLIEFGMLAHVVTHHEESCLRVKLSERVEDEGCSLGDGPVIEGQVDGLLMMVHSPIGFRIEPAEINGGLLYEHLFTLHFSLFTFHSSLLTSHFSLPRSSFRLVESHIAFQLLLLLVGLLRREDVLHVEHLLHDVNV